MSSEAAHVGPVTPARPPKSWEQVPASADNTDTLWSEGVVQLQQPATDGNSEETETAEDPTAPAPGDPGELLQGLAKVSVVLDLFM